MKEPVDSDHALMRLEPDPACRIIVLGRARIIDADGTAGSLPGGLQGRLLQALILSVNSTVPHEDLVAELWPDVDPEVALARLRVTATRLRRRMQGGPRVEGVEGGYRLAATEADLDLVEFSALAERAKAGDPEAAARALKLWQGEPFEGFAISPATMHERQRLTVVYQTILQQACEIHGTSLANYDEEHRLDDPSPVPRPRLLDRLPGIGKTRLIEVAAPAGFGKTVLLRQWASREGEGVVWHALRPDEGAAGPLADLTEKTSSVIGRPSDVGSGSPQTTNHLINILSDHSRPVAIVIDDFHLADEELQMEVQGLLDRAPACLTVALASRRRLPLSIGRLHAGGNVIAFSARDLAFTREEAVRALANSTGTALDEEQLASVLQATGGLPRAVIEIGSELSSIPLEDLTSSALPILENMAGEMLESTPEPATDLMAATAHLDNVIPQLAEALSGRDDCTVLLRTLADDHLLLDRTDDGYTHHPVVARGLRRLLQRDGKAAPLHSLTARWYLQRDAPARALHHALAAGDDDTAAASLAGALDQGLRSGDGAALRRWISRSPMPDTQGKARILATLTTALIGDHRHRRPAPRGPHPAVDQVVAAFEHARAGRCGPAMSSVAEAKRNLMTQPPASDAVRLAIEGLLSIIETESRVMLDELDGGGHRAPPRRPSHTEWPWLHAWETGNRALHAYAAGSSTTAQALLEHGRHQVQDTEGSWLQLESGVTALVGAVILSDRATTRSEQLQAMAAASSALERADEAGHAPVGALANLALHRSRLRVGDRNAAAESLAEADERAARLPDLPILRSFRRVVVEEGGPADPAEAIRTLTESELNVLRFIGTGRTFADIASALFLSPHTVRTHVRSIYRKLGVTSRPMAVRLLRGLSIDSPR